MSKGIPAPRWLLWIALPIFIGVLGMGIHGLVKRLHERKQGVQSLSWWQAEAIVMRCEPHYHSGGKHSSSSESATISYRYAVRDQPLFSDRVTVARKRLSEGVEAFVLGHPVGAKITVYYDPQRPTDAVIFPGPDKQNMIWLVSSGLLALAGLWFSISTTRDLFRDSEQNKIPAC